MYLEIILRIVGLTQPLGFSDYYLDAGERYLAE